MKGIKKNKGITLIALVVTIVVILILAGVSIGLVVGENGIITNAKEAKAETIKAAEKSAVELATLGLKMADNVDGESNFNAQNLKTEVEKNYGQGENTVTVKGETIYIVTFIETGNKYLVNSDGSVLEIGNIEFDLIYYLKNQGTVTDIVLIPISGTNINGSAEILCPDGNTITVPIGEERIYTVSEDGIYTFVGKYIGITVTKEIEIKNENQTSVGEIQSQDIETRIVPGEITNKDVEVTIINKRLEYTLQYSLNGIEWIDYNSPIIMENNGQIHVRLSSGTSSSTNNITINVTNIDKLPPKSFTPTATSTTNSITLSGSTTDAEVTSTNASSGIKAYYFSKDNGASWEGGTTSTKYTFTGLKQGIVYNLKMKAVDNAGNETITNSISKETVKIPESTGNTTFTYNPTDWTNGNVTVTITTSITGYTLQYSLNGTSWTNYTQSIIRTENGPVYARVVDGSEQTGGTATGNVTNIDKLAPNNFTPTATSTTNSVTLSGSTTDAEATSTNESSGIKAYYFSKDNGVSWEGGTTSTSHTFTGLSQETTYNLKMKAVDNAGNETITSTVNKQTLSALPTFNYTGDYEVVNDDDTPYTKGNTNWKIKFLTSGKLTFNTAQKIDAFLVGGGGSGGGGYSGSTQDFTGGTGGPGKNATYLNIDILNNFAYDIVIGNGGAASNYSKAGYDGESTSAFGKIVSGGSKGGGAHSGGGGYHGIGVIETYEFDECNPVSTVQYSKRGGGEANTGNSGTGGRSTKGGNSGGSGIVIIRNNRTVEETVPISFSYTGNYEILNDNDTQYIPGNKNWKIKFLTSGTLKLTTTDNFDGNVDVFLVGGGASGGGGYDNNGGSWRGGNGGPGYNATYSNINLTTGSYDIIIGKGGAYSYYNTSGNNGEDTSAFGKTVSGGAKGVAGGTNGAGGIETYAFGDSSMGTAKYSVSGSLLRNTGNSGKGSSGVNLSESGSSGIVIIRNKR